MWESGLKAAADAQLAACDAGNALAMAEEQDVHELALLPVHTFICFGSCSLTDMQMHCMLQLGSRAALTRGAGQGSRDGAPRCGSTS